MLLPSSEALVPVPCPIPTPRPPGHLASPAGEAAGWASLVLLAFWRRANVALGGPPHPFLHPGNRNTGVLGARRTISLPQGGAGQPRCRPDGGLRLGRGVSHTGGACPGASALPAVMLLPLPPAFRKFPSRKASGNPRGEVPASGCSPGMRLGPCCTELPPQRPAGTAQLGAAPRAAVPEPSPQGQRFRRLTQPCTCRCPGEEEEAATPRVP